MKLVCDLALICALTHAVVCQDDVFDSMGLDNVQNNIESSDFGPFQLFGQDCQYEIKPLFYGLQKVFQGTAYCPDWTNLVGISRTDNKMSAVKGAIEDLVEKSSRKDLASEQEIQDFLQGSYIKQVLDTISEKDNSLVGEARQGRQILQAKPDRDTKKTTPAPKKPTTTTKKPTTTKNAEPKETNGGSSKKKKDKLNKSDNSGSVGVHSVNLLISFMMLISMVFINSC